VGGNISSPNTEKLRQLQDSGHLRELLEAIVKVGEEHGGAGGGKCPIVVKIAPDWEDAALTDALETIAGSGVDGLNATNTTISRDAIAGLPHANEAGGLSGAPLLQPANRVLKKCREVLGDSFPIMGSGGIMSGSDAVAKIAAGADVVQLYTGFIYNGPDLVGDCARAIAEEYANAD